MQRMKRSFRISAIVCALGLLVSGAAWALTRPSLPLRNDIVAEGFVGAGFITVTYDTKPETNPAAITSGRIVLSAENIDCRPGNGVSCRYHLNELNLATSTIDTHGVSLTHFRYRLIRPIYNLIDSGRGLVLGTGTEFLVETIVNGTKRELVVSPESAGEFRIYVNLDQRRITAENNLSGSGVDSDGKAVELSIDLLATAVDFKNLPPRADAGPDQVHETACYADVTLTPQSTDPDNDIRLNIFSEGNLPLGSGGPSRSVRMLPGSHHVGLMTRDSWGSYDRDELTVTVRDNGQVPTPPGGSLVQFDLPPGVARDEVALLAKDTLKISDRVRVSGPNGAPTKVVNLGPASAGIRSYFHADSVTTGSVWSRPKAWLLERARISGALYTSVDPERQNNTSASVVQPFTFAPLGSFSFPVAAAGPITQAASLEPGQVASLLPGEYGFMSIKSRATLRLTSGFYRFSQLLMEPDSSIVLSGAEPTVVVLSEGATLRGRVTADAGGGLLLLHLGSAETIVTSPFVGAVLAPNAKLTLNSASNTKHVGAFFAKEIQVDSAAIIEHSASVLRALEVDRSACALAPIVKCVQSTPQGRIAHFTYQNAIHHQGTWVQQGYSNRILTGPTDQGQPIAFSAGFITPRSFTVPFGSGQSVTWILGSRRATATPSSPACQ